MTAALPLVGSEPVDALEIEKARQRGRGLLTIEGELVSLTEGLAAFVPAGAEHQFTGYEGMSVLIISSRQKERTPLEERRAKPHPV
jgi:mannose-6-phosphate isomerase-like protein (cupin superfamily)